MSAEESADHKLDPNYAVVVSFLEQFGHFVVQNPLDISIDNLDTFILNKEVDENDKFIKFHLKLLAGIGNRAKPEQWEKGLIKFCKDFPERDDELIKHLGYVDIPAAAKLRILKNLCEDQFEYNNNFNVKVNELLGNKFDGDVIRHMPAGSDRQGRMYWYMTDKVGNVRLYRGMRDDINNKEIWTLVCSDPEELKDFIDFLQTYDEDELEDIEFNEDFPAPSKLLFSKDFLKVTEDDAEEIFEETKDPKQIFYKVPKARTTAQIKRDETKHKLKHSFIKMLETDKSPADKSLEKQKEMEKEREKDIENKEVQSTETQEEPVKDNNLKKVTTDADNCIEEKKNSIEGNSDKDKNSTGGISDKNKNSTGVISDDKIKLKDNIFNKEDRIHDEEHEKTNSSTQGIDDTTSSEICVNNEDSRLNGSKIKQSESQRKESSDTCIESEENLKKKLVSDVQENVLNSSEKSKFEQVFEENEKNIDSNVNVKSSVVEFESEIHKKECKDNHSRGVEADTSHKSLDLKNELDSIYTENSESNCKSNQSVADELDKSESCAENDRVVELIKDKSSSNQVEIPDRAGDRESELKENPESNSGNASVDSADDDDLDMKETLMRISELSDAAPSPISTSNICDKTSRENETLFVKEKTNSEQSKDSSGKISAETLEDKVDEDVDSDGVAFDEALKGLKTLEEAVKLDSKKDDNGENCKQNGVVEDEPPIDPFDDAIKGLETLEKIIDQGNVILDVHKTNMNCNDEDESSNEKGNSSKLSAFKIDKSKEKLCKNTDSEIGNSGDNKKINTCTKPETIKINEISVEKSNVKEFKGITKQDNQEFMSKNEMKDQSKLLTSCPEPHLDIKTELAKLSKDFVSKTSPNKVENKKIRNSDSLRQTDSKVGKILKVELDRVDNLLKVDKLDLENTVVNVGSLDTKSSLLKISHSKVGKIETSVLNGFKLEPSDDIEKCGDGVKVTSKNEGPGIYNDKNGIKKESVLNSESKMVGGHFLDCPKEDKQGLDNKKADKISSKGKIAKPKVDQKKDKTKCTKQKEVGNKTHTMVVDGDILEINQLSTDSEDDDNDDTEDVEPVSKKTTQRSKSISANTNEIGQISNTCDHVAQIETTKQLAKEALKKNMTRTFLKDVQGKHGVVQNIGIPTNSSITTSKSVQVITLGTNGIICNPQASSTSPLVMDSSISALLGSVGSFANPIVLGSDSSHRMILPKPAINPPAPSVQLNNVSSKPSKRINTGETHTDNPHIRSLLSSWNVNYPQQGAPAVGNPKSPHLINSSISTQLSQCPNYTVKKPSAKKMVTVGRDGKYYDKFSGKPFAVPQNGKQIRVGYDGKFYDAKTLQLVNLNLSKSSLPLDIRPGATFFLVPTKNVPQLGPTNQNQNYSVATNTTRTNLGCYSKITPFTHSSQYNKSRPFRKRRGRYKKEVIELTSSSDSDISIHSDKDGQVVVSDNSDSDYDYDTISRRIREAALKSTRRPTKMPNYIELSGGESSDDLYIEEEPEEAKIKPPPPPKEVQYELLRYPCSICESSDNNPTILTCEECESTYHMGCLSPPLLSIPTEDWFCPQCEHLMLIETLKEKYKALRKLLNKKQRKESRITTKMFAINRDNIMEVLLSKDVPFKITSEMHKVVLDSPMFKVTTESKYPGGIYVFDKFLSRSVRARKEVNYDETRYDKIVKNAVKEMNESENEDSTEETSKKTRLSISSDESDRELSDERDPTGIKEDQKKKKLLPSEKNTKPNGKRSLRPKFSDSEDEGPTDRKHPKTEDENVRNNVKKDRSVSVEKDQRKSQHSKSKKDRCRKKRKTRTEAQEREGGNKTKRTSSQDSDFNLLNADQNSTDTEGESGDTEDYEEEIAKKAKSEEHIYYTSSGRKTNSLSKLKNIF